MIGSTLLVFAMTAAVSAAPPAPGKPSCAPVKDAPGPAIQQTFAALTMEYIDVLPGPRGQALRDKRVERIIADSLDVASFAARTLTRAWQAATPDARARWTATLGAMLHRKYRDRLRDPHTYRLVVTKTALDCIDARLTVTLQHRGRPTKKSALLLRVSHDQRRVKAGRSGWRVYDVAVDGTSLLAMWRSRFARIYRAGGIAAVDAQLQKLAVRYPCKSAGCRKTTP